MNVSYYIEEFPFINSYFQNESRFDINGTIKEKKEI